MGQKKVSGVLISGVRMHARMVHIGVGKVVLFREVSSVHWCPYRRDYSSWGTVFVFMFELVFVSCFLK